MVLSIILEAAGNSTRFGSNKLLHEMDDGRPMVCSAMDAAREASAMLKDDTVRIVLVTQYPEIAALGTDMEVVFNHYPEYGISHSMQLGIEASGDADAYMFCVCDQPGLKASTIVRLTDTFRHTSAGIVSLAWKGRMCNPKIFSAVYRDELMSVSGDTGGRQIIRNHTDDLISVEADSEIETIDIDRPVHSIRTE